MKQINPIDVSVRIIPYSFIVAASAVFLVSGKQIPLPSYLNYMTIIFVAFSLMGFFYGQFLNFKNQGKKVVNYLIGFFMAVIFSGSIAFLMFVLTYLINQAYPGAYVLRFAGIIGAGALAAFATYLSIGESLKAQALEITKYLAVFMFGGLLLSALAETDPMWYVESFSYLGMVPSTAAKIFNITMIFSGLGTIALSTLLIRDIEVNFVGKALNKKDLKTDKVLFFLLGVGIFFVGLIPYGPGIQGTIHTIAANVSGVSFLLLCIMSKKYLPKLTNPFYKLSYFLALVTLVTAIFFFLDQAQLATVEIIVFISVFVWVYFMIQTMEYLKTKPSS